MTNITGSAARKPRSIFAAYDGETLSTVSTGPTRRTGLTDMDKLIMVAVDQLLVTTCDLLYTHLCGAGLRDVSVDDMRAALKRLSDNGYLRRMEFVAKTARSNYKVYALGSLGREFISAAGRRPRLSGYIDSLDALYCKRLLAATQFVVRRGLSAAAKGFTVGGIVAEARPGDDGPGDNIFRSQCIVQREDSTMFVEAVRAGDDCLDDLMSKLRRMDTTLRQSRCTNVTIQSKVMVVIVCESSDHMYEVVDELRDENGRYCFDIVLTNDMEVFSSPGACLHAYEVRRGLGRVFGGAGKLAAEGR